MAGVNWQAKRLSWKLVDYAGCWESAREAGRNKNARIPKKEGEKKITAFFWAQQQQ